MADDRIVIEIELDDGTVKKGFVKVQEQAKVTGKSIGKSFSGSGMAGFATKLAGIAAGFLAVRKAGQLFNEAIAGAARQQDAIQKLNIALAQTGIFTQKTSESMQTFASGLQQVTKFGDEAVLETSALIQSLGQLDEAGLQRATKATLDLSTALGIELNAAATLVGKAATGEVSSFTRYGVAIKKTGNAAKDFETTLLALESKFGGFAEKATKTFSGSLQQMQNSFGDLLEELGNVIIKSPAIVAAFNKFSELFSNIGKQVKAFVESGEAELLIKNISSIATALITVFAYPIEFAVNVVKVAFNTIKGVFQQLLVDIVGIASGIANFFAPDSDIAKNLNTFHESSSVVLKEFEGDLYGSIAALNDFSNSDAIVEFAEKFNISIQASTMILADFKNAAKETAADTGISFSQIKEAFTAEAEAMKITAKDVASTIRKSMVSGVSSGFASFGKALATGKNGFKEFGKSVLQTLGGLAIQMGQMFILIGAGMTATAGLLGLSGGAAIAAGIGLTVLGGVLQGIAGGGGGASVGAGATGGEAGGTTTTELPSIEDSKPTTTVAINVQGDILDSSDSGLRIVELIQSYSDKNGNTVLA